MPMPGVLLLGLVLLALPRPSWPQPLPATASEARPQVIARAITTPPRIDGVLDDSAWGAAIPTGEWRSYNPLYGNTVPQQTRVWVAYDSEAFYFAFACEDPDPSAIKTSISRRDNFAGDDWVGLSLDALGSGQLSYHMMVNPSGVQLDLLNSAAGDEDWTVDWVWESAGRQTATGYSVEIRLPLRSIRFASGENVRMGLLFWRRVSRLGVSVAWPPLEPGRWVFDRHAALTIPRLDARRPRDVIPSATLSERQARDTTGAWSPLSAIADTGVSLKVGLTSAVSLDATINPDFSQVESDAYQVEVNQRFPVFYSEKRPFFMEGAGIFTLAGSGGDNSLQAAVHTRRMIDPAAGAKLTGAVGRTTVAWLSVIDQSPGAANAPAGGKRLFNVGRAQYSLGPGAYVGAIVSDVEQGAFYNRVAGADIRLRLSNAQRLTAFALASRSRHEAGGEGEPGRAAHPAGGTAAHLGYSYSTRALAFSASLEHLDREFQMDTAFINRVGITSVWAFADRSFYPRGGTGWLRRISPFTFAQAASDRRAHGQDRLVVSGLRLNFTRQGFFRLDRSWGQEPWAGREFARGRWRSWGNVQITRWLKLDGRLERGRAVYYDLDEPFAGRSWRANGGFVLQPSGRLSQQFSWDHVVLVRPGGSLVYAVDVANSKTIYQFTRRLYARELLQFDSARRRILSDVLLSYEVNPGTIAYVGYGGLFERVMDPFRATARGLLFKLSYLKRF